MPNRLALVGAVFAAIAALLGPQRASADGNWRHLVGRHGRPAYVGDRRGHDDPICGRAVMNQWISAVNSYYYPYMIYHVGHERNVFPVLGIPSDEKIVAHALPKIEVALQVMERQLSHGRGFLVGADVEFLPINASPVLSVKHRHSWGDILDQRRRDFARPGPSRI